VEEMRVAIIFFPISNMIGGDLTVNRGLRLGLRRLGHEADIFEVCYNKKRLSSKRVCTDADYVIGFHGKLLDDAIAKLSEYDMTIFSPPTPPFWYDDLEWTKLYEKLNDKTKIAIIFHSPSMKGGEYATKIKQYVDCVISAEPNFVSPAKLIKDKVWIMGTLIDREDFGLYDDMKIKLAISLNQFKRWKRVDIFIRAIPKLPTIHFHVYSDGVERYKMAGKRRSKQYMVNGKWIWDEAKKVEGFKYCGFAPRETVIEDLKRSMCVVDMSEIRGQYNIVEYEAMAYGSIPIARETVIVDGYMNRENILLVKGDTDDELVESLAKTIKDVTDNFNGYRDMRIRNLKFVEQFASPKAVASRLLTYLHDNNII
jgi:glycosyltransferase involved in cell wall biosynthesis